MLVDDAAAGGAWKGSSLVAGPAEVRLAGLQAQTIFSRQPGVEHHGVRNAALVPFSAQMSGLFKQARATLRPPPPHGYSHPPAQAGLAHASISIVGSSSSGEPMSLLTSAARSTSLSVSTSWNQKNSRVDDELNLRQYTRSAAFLNDASPGNRIRSAPKHPAVSTGAWLKLTRT